jgi:hypothetical protein
MTSRWRRARTTDTVLKAVHRPSATLEVVGAAARHILGEHFSTVAPLRFGDYVAKIGFALSSKNFRDLTGESVDLEADYNALQPLSQRFFSQPGGCLGGEGAACTGP